MAFNPGQDLLNVLVDAPIKDLRLFRQQVAATDGGSSGLRLGILPWVPIFHPGLPHRFLIIRVEYDAGVKKWLWLIGNLGNHECVSFDAEANMELIGPHLIAQVDAIRRRVVHLGRTHKISGRQMAALARVKEKRVRSYLEDPGWREDSVDLLVAMETAIAHLGLLPPCAVSPDTLVDKRPALQIAPHRKVHLNRHAVLLNEQIQVVNLYLQAAAKGGIIYERDVKVDWLRSRAPDCALHVYSVDDLESRILVSHWRPVADYFGGADITGANILADFPGSMADCIREDVSAAMRTPTLPHFSLIQRRFGDGDPALPSRSFLRLMQYIVGNGDVPKLVVARSLQPNETASQYFDDLGIAGPRKIQ